MMNLTGRRFRRRRVADGDATAFLVRDEALEFLPFATRHGGSNDRGERQTQEKVKGELASVAHKEHVPFDTLT